MKCHFSTVALVAALSPINSVFAQGGQVFGWGSNSFGQASSAPPGMLPTRVLVAGGDFTAELRSDGSFVGWGDNGAGQLGAPANMGPIAQLAVGDAHAYALSQDGTLRGWGAGSANSPDSHPHYGQSMTPSNLGVVSQFACGGLHTYALLADGTLRGWGRNNAGQTNTPGGLGTVTQVACSNVATFAVLADGSLRGWGSTGTIPGGIGPVARVVCGSFHTYVHRTNGTIVGWGGGSEGASTTPADLGVVSQVECGGYFTYALLPNGTLRSWGANEYGQRNTPTDLGAVMQVACGAHHTCVLLMDGTVRMWGRNNKGQTSARVQVSGVTQVAGGLHHSYALRTDGTLIGWGRNDYGQTNTPVNLGAVTAVACGGSHTYALKPNGTVQGWGGEGIDNYGQTTTPTGLGVVTQVACGWYHTYALNAAGALFGWGNNSFGQTSTPSDVGVASKVACGKTHTYALRPNGTLRGWGDNQSGQINTPASLASVVQVACGGTHTCALRSDGTVRAWGAGNFDNYGQVAIPADLGSVVEVACGAFHTYLLLADGSLRGFGGSPNDPGVTSVSGNAGAFSRVACGFGHTLALLSPSASSCSNPGGTGTATLSVSGSAWENVSIWSWSDGGGPQVPGLLTNVDLGDFGSVGSTCDAQCATLVARSGSTLIVPADLADASTWGNHSVSVSGAATMAGRVWLLGSGASTLPADLNIPVVVTGNPQGTFDVIQTTVPPPAGKFLTLVPSSSLGGGTTYSLRLLDLPGSASLTGASSGTFVGTAVAAEAMDWNGDGFDDLALAIDFGTSQPGRLQVLLNDGEGNLGGTSVQVSTPAGPQCLAVGDVNQDGKTDAVVCIGSNQTGQIYLNAFTGSTQGAPFTAGATLPVGGNPLSAIVIPPAGGSSLVEGPGGPSVGMGSGGSGGGGSGTSVKVFNPTTGQVQQSVTVPGTPNALVRRGRQLGTGGNNASTVGGSDLPGFLALLTPDAQGQYAVTQQVAVPGVPKQMDAADIDGDGYEDIVSANASPQVQGTGTALPVLTLFRGGPVQVGQAVPIAPVGGTAGLDISLIDADSDGDRDLVSVHQTVVGQSKAVLIQIDTPGPGAPLTIGAQTDLDASRPILSTRGNLDGVGGEDLFLVDSGTSSLSLQGGSGPAVRPFRGDPGTPPCLADINGDGRRDGVDLGNLLAQWGVSGSADINSSGTVDGVDLAFLLANWGLCP